MKVQRLALVSLFSAVWLVGCAQNGAIPDVAALNATDDVEAAAAAKLPANRSGKLTYLTYEALDNNLHGDLKAVLNKLEVVGSNAGLNLLAQTDDEGPKNSFRYLMQADKSPEVTSPSVAISSENSSSPTTLKSAVSWAFKSYPASTRWLNLSSHGMGWQGVLADDDPQGFMSIQSFAKAVKAGVGSGKLDLVSFDACLMATAEVAEELKDTAEIMVASEDVTMYWGYGYQDTMTKVASRPSMAPADIAVDLVETVHDTRGGKVAQSYSVSAFNLSKATASTKAIDALAVVLLKKAGYRGQIRQAIQNLKPFVIGGKDVIEFRDFGNVLNLLGDIKDPEIKAAVSSARAAVFNKGGMIIKSRNHRFEQFATTGLSIYAPTKNFDPSYKQTAFAKATHWDEFVETLCL